MPKDFLKCVKEGGKMVTKSLKGRKYVHGCKPKKGGDVIWGEVKEKKETSNGYTTK